MEKRRTLTVDQLSESTKRIVVMAAKDLLHGVGQLPSAVEQVEYAIHYRRALTEAEFAALPEAWCAIPAIHDAGRGLILEENT